MVANSMEKRENPDRDDLASLLNTRKSLVGTIPRDIGGIPKWFSGGDRYLHEVLHGGVVPELLELRDLLERYTVVDLKSSFSKVFQCHQGELNFEGHSLHPRPDAVYQADRYCAFAEQALLGDKWGFLFERVIPTAQRNLASLFNIDDPKRIWFAPSTHEFLTRLLSCLPKGPLSILTSDCEFDSANRQLNATSGAPSAGEVEWARSLFEVLGIPKELHEVYQDAYKRFNTVVLDRVEVDPIETFSERFLVRVREQKTLDMVVLSHYFFNRGREVEGLLNLVSEIKKAHPGCVILLDAYHNPADFDYSEISKYCYIAGGGYKYYMWGEGACYLCVPPQCELEPRNTGWMATFEKLRESRRGANVSYPDGGQKFAGATWDTHGLFRLIEVFDWLSKNKLSFAAISTHVMALQQYFLAYLETLGNFGPLVRGNEFLPGKGDGGLQSNLTGYGHFLAFKIPPEQIEKVQEILSSLQIYTDARGDCLRFGFGCYQTLADIDELFRRLNDNRAKFDAFDLA